MKNRHRMWTTGKLNIVQMLIVAIAAISIIASSSCSAADSGKTGSATPTSRSRTGSVTPTSTSKAGSVTPTPTSNTGSGEMRRPWTAIHNWAYWLDGPDLKQLGATNFELVVIDYSADGSAQKAFSAEQIKTLQRSTCQRRVVAYLSIGQAESYRGYWQQGWQQGSPTWLDAADPNWDRNYWVHYWDPAWQQIIYRYLDDIIAAGFDGVYLDRVDAYEENYAAGHEDDMVRFVTDIARYARARSPLGQDFGVIVQNAEDLAARHMDYVQTVTGIGREEVYVQATNRATSALARNTTQQYLDLFRQNSRGKLVLTVDYANSADQIRAAYEQSWARGYVPYVAPVGLDRLQMNSGYQPGCDSV